MNEIIQAGICAISVVTLLLMVCTAIGFTDPDYNEMGIIQNAENTTASA